MCHFFRPPYPWWAWAFLIIPMMVAHSRRLATGRGASGTTPSRPPAPGSGPPGPDGRNQNGEAPLRFAVSPLLSAPPRPNMRPQLHNQGDHCRTNGARLGSQWPSPRICPVEGVPGAFEGARFDGVSLIPGTGLHEEALSEGARSAADLSLRPAGSGVEIRDEALIAVGFHADHVFGPPDRHELLATLVMSTVAYQPDGDDPLNIPAMHAFFTPSAYSSRLASPSSPRPPTRTDAGSRPRTPHEDRRPADHPLHHLNTDHHRTRYRARRLGPASYRPRRQAAPHRHRRRCLQPRGVRRHLPRRTHPARGRVRRLPAWHS